eukprot:s49_g12.t1
MDEELDAALRQATSDSNLSGEQKAELFTALRRQGAKAPQQLATWDAKAELLRFLASLYEEKRLYHRQVVSFLELLLEQPGWAAAAQALRNDWPEEMAKVVPEGSETGNGTAVPTTKVAESVAESTGGYATEAPVAPQRSMADTFAMLEDALKRLSDANYRFAVSTGSGLEEDDHLMAFEVFRRAVCRVTQDHRIQKNVLDQISPKDLILQFLLEVMDQKPRHKKRIEALLLLLMQLDSWRLVAEDEKLHAATALYRKNMEPVDEAEPEEVAVVETDEVEELLADARRRGAFGVLLIRVLAAHNLVNADWFSLSDPYAKVTVDKVSKTTPVVDDCLDPHWDEELWNFDVEAESSIVRLEVWDKDTVQDDSLGSISVPISMAPPEMKRLRFHLDRVAHGELEVEMQFLRLETEDDLELIKSGGRSVSYKLGAVKFQTGESTWDYDGEQLARNPAHPFHDYVDGYQPSITDPFDPKEVSPEWFATLSSAGSEQAYQTLPEPKNGPYGHAQSTGTWYRNAAGEFIDSYVYPKHYAEQAELQKTTGGDMLHLLKGSAKKQANWFEILELAVYDDAAKPQGTALVGVLKKGEPTKYGLGFLGTYLGASDEFYRYWATEGAGQLLQDKATYHLCQASVAECRQWSKRKDVIHSDKVRTVGPTEIREGKLSWLRSREKRDPVIAALMEFEKRVKRRSVTEEDLGDVNRPEDKESGGSLVMNLPVTLSLRRKKKERAREGRLRSTSRKETAREKPKGKKRKSPSSEERPERSRSSKKKTRVESPDKAKKKKKLVSEERSESESASGSEEGTLFKSAKSKPVERKPGMDHGPFGGGPALYYGKRDRDSDTESEESVFRDAPTKSMSQSGQQRLALYSRKYPGRLASRLLIKMREGSARDLVGAHNEDTSTPPLASHFLLTVLIPALGQRASLRTQRELRTLGKGLDLLAKGETGQCADLLCQRVKALDRAAQEGHWNSAQYLELLPPDRVTLLERDEELYLRNEYIIDRKAKQYERPQFPPVKPAKGEGKTDRPQKGKGNSPS